MWRCASTHTEVLPVTLQPEARDFVRAGLPYERSRFQYEVFHACLSCGLRITTLCKPFRERYILEVPRMLCQDCPLRVEARMPCGIMWRRWSRTTLRGESLDIHAFCKIAQQGLES